MHKLQILLLEAIASDAELINKYLERSGLEFEATIVTSNIELMVTLEQKAFDIVLADHSQGSVEALKMAREKDASIPFILVGGYVSEDEAIRVMQTEGAEDYILIDHLKRLPIAIEKAIEH